MSGNFLVSNISNENIYTWYIFATEIFKEVELNKNNFEDFNNAFFLVKDTSKNTFKKNITVKEKYEENNSFPYTKFHYCKVL
jgi:hypothetical protein